MNFAQQPADNAENIPQINLLHHKKGGTHLITAGINYTEKPEMKTKKSVLLCSIRQWQTQILSIRQWQTQRMMILPSGAALVLPPYYGELYVVNLYAWRAPDPRESMKPS